MPRSQPLRWLLPLLMLLGCQRPSPPPLTQGVTAIAWRLGWDTARLQRGPQGWDLQTDLGYRVHITRGTLTTWRLGLELCPKKAAWSLIPQAEAHHVEAPDPTSLIPHLAEDLTALTATDLGPRDVPVATYCRGLWLASAPPASLAADRPRVSLLLRGQWEKQGQTGTLDVETWMPDARFAPIPGLPEAHGATRIAVERHLAAAFDGVDLAQAPTPALAWTLLHKLVDGATWRAESVSRGSTSTQ